MTKKITNTITIAIILLLTISCSIDKEINNYSKSGEGDSTPGDSQFDPNEYPQENENRHDREEGEGANGEQITIYTFSGNDVRTCNSLIKDRFGYSAALCTIGGACGADACGKPGGTCTSKQPTIPGACLYSTDISDQKPDAQVPIIGATVEFCNQIVTDTFGFLAKECTIGGSCNAANPGEPGACLTEADFPAPEGVIEKTITTYNFTSYGGIETCNALVTNAFGYLKEACVIGGGCGVGCGIPGADCESAKPTLAGACIVVTQ